MGCKENLAEFLPSVLVEGDQELTFVKPANSIGEVKNFYGNFLVVVKALTYILTLGREGLLEASQNAVLNANYMMHKLKDLYTIACNEVCMHEFVMSLADLKKQTGVSAMDIAKGLLDHGIHPPTMYFPLIVEEALMVEPTETESKETLDEAIQVFRELYELAGKDPDSLHEGAVTTPVTRLDEVALRDIRYLDTGPEESGTKRRLAMEQRFDLIVIGAGPGGYVAAIKAAKAGLQVAVVEEDAVGGTCLNRGCIPAKALIHASSLYRQALDGEKYGILAKEVSYDYAKVLTYKEETTERLCRGVEQLLKGNKVTLLYGKGRLEIDRTVTVTSEEGIRTFEAGNVILAAGSKPMLLPLPGMEP